MRAFLSLLLTLTVAVGLPVQDWVPVQSEKFPQDQINPVFGDMPPVLGHVIQEDPKPVVRVEPKVQEKPVGQSPVVQDKPVEQVPLVDKKPVEQVPVVDEKPVEQAPVVDKKPAEQVPMEEDEPAEQSPVEQDTHVEEKNEDLVAQKNVIELEPPEEDSDMANAQQTDPGMVEELLAESELLDQASVSEEELIPEEEYLEAQEHVMKPEPLDEEEQMQEVHPKGSKSEGAPEEALEAFQGEELLMQRAEEKNNFVAEEPMMSESLSEAGPVPEEELTLANVPEPNEPMMEEEEEEEEFMGEEGPVMEGEYVIGEEDSEGEEPVMEMGLLSEEEPAVMEDPQMEDAPLVDDLSMGYAMMEEEPEEGLYHRWESPVGENPYVNDYFLLGEDLPLEDQENQYGAEPLAARATNEDAVYRTPACGVVLNGRCYQFFRGPKTAYDAEFFCQNNVNNGHLASVTSRTIHNHMMALMDQNGGRTRTWIGGLKYLKTGRFIWLDGARWSYADWLPGEPNDTVGVEDCVELLSNGKFNDMPCWDLRAFICSYPAK